MPARKVLRAAARATPRRQHYGSSTRKSLLENATVLFTERGYAGTSLDEIVKAADVTKGALYHHYAGKLDLFEDVFERTQRDASKRIDAAIKSQRDPWQRAIAGTREFLHVCREPTYRRIVMQEAPVAMGHERWQASERNATFGLIERVVDEIFARFEVGSELAEAFGHVFYGTMRTAGEYVADSDDQDTTSRNVEIVIGIVLAGLQQIAEIGPELVAELASVDGDPDSDGTDDRDDGDDTEGPDAEDDHGADPR